MFLTVTGGSGSGKSAFAEKCAVLLAHSDESLLPSRGPVYLAAMNPAGREGRMRVMRHRAMRRGKGFETIERQRDLAGIPGEKILGRTILVEDLSNLIANELFGGDAAPDESALSARAERACLRVREGIEDLASRAGHLILVMNEIFSDGIRYDRETDQFLRAAGLLSREFVSRADLSFEVVFGIPLILKGEELIREKLPELLDAVNESLK